MMHIFYTDDEGEEFSIAVFEQTNIDQNNLAAELADQANRYVKFAVLAEALRHQKESLKAELDQLFAHLYYEAKETAPPRSSETSLKLAVQTAPLYQEALEKFLDKERQYRVVGALCTALTHRKDMLRSLNNLRGQEIGSYS